MADHHRQIVPGRAHFGFEPGKQPGFAEDRGHVESESVGVEIQSLRQRMTRPPSPEQCRNCR